MKIEVTAIPRALQGTGASRRLRRDGKVPGIVYGAGKEAVSIELDHNALMKHLRTEAFHASILDMKIGDAKEPVLLRDYQMHPFRPIVLHADFQRVAKDRKIHMRVPLHFVNAETSPGVKLGGGSVSHVMNEVEIECLPDALPEFIEVDLGAMQLGDALHALDLKLPPGVELLARLRHDNQVVASVQVPRQAAAEEPAAGAAPTTEITSQKPEDAAKDGDKKDAGKKDGGK